MENLIAPHNEYPSKKIDDLVQRADWGYAVAIVPSPSPSPVTADNSEGQPCTGHVPASFPTSVIIKNSEIVDSPVIDLFDPTALPTKPTDTPHTSTESANYVNVVGMGSHVLVPELIPISKLPISDEILALTGRCNREGDRRRTIVASPLWRTGTWPWISAQSIVTNPGEPVIYETYHDLESFFYVLLGTCLLLKEPSKFKGEDELGLCFNKIFYLPGPTGLVKTVTIQSNLAWLPMIVAHISPYFKPLIPLLNRLRKEIISPMYISEYRILCCAKSLTHQVLIEAIIEALRGLPDSARIKCEKGELLYRALSYWNPCDGLSKH